MHNYANALTVTYIITIRKRNFESHFYCKSIDVIFMFIFCFQLIGSMLYKPRHITSGYTLTHIEL
jgi:hypothetical protein